MTEPRDMSAEIRQSSVGKCYIGSVKVYGNSFQEVLPKLENLVKAVALQVDNWNRNIDKTTYPQK